MYTTNDRLPKLRAEAVQMVRSGKTTREVALHFGYSQSVIVKWCAKAKHTRNPKRIETLSSRPHTCPNQISKELEAKVVDIRLNNKRCAEVIQKILKDQKEILSLATVKRVIRRNGLSTKKSLWKKTRTYPPRPDVLQPGDLVEIDTIHITRPNKTRTYIYTAIDVYSRIGYAKRYEKCCVKNSMHFLTYIKNTSTFTLKTIQTDNGSEFSQFFTDFANRLNINHRHNHPRSPNENGHLERFNRTVQDEPWKFGFTYWKQESLDEYMLYYNTKRHHLGINLKTPREMLDSK
jgi:transposase InsO family protein